METAVAVPAANASRKIGVRFALQLSVLRVSANEQPASCAAKTHATTLRSRAFDVAKPIRSESRISEQVSKRAKVRSARHGGFQSSAHYLPLGCAPLRGALDGPEQGAPRSGVPTRGDEPVTRQWRSRRA